MNTTHNNLSTVTKIALLALALLAAQSVSMLYLNYNQFRQNLIEEVEIEKAGMAIHLKGILSYLYKNNEMAQLTKVISEFSQDERIKELILVDKKGRVLFSSAGRNKLSSLYDEPGGLNVPVSSLKETLLAASNAPIPLMVMSKNKDSLIFVQEIFSTSADAVSQPPIFLTVIDFSWIDKTLFLGFVKSQVSVWLISCLGVIIFMLVVYYFYIRRIELMTRMARQINEGDYSLRIADDSNDEVGFLAKFFNEILDTFVKRHELLETSEYRLRMAMESTSDGIWEWNLKTGDLYLSSRLEMILNYHPGSLDLNIETLGALVHPDDYGFVSEEIRFDGQREKQKPFFGFKCRLRNKGGDWLWVIMRGKVSAKDEAGLALSVVGTIADISEHVTSENKDKARRARIQRYQKALNEWTNVDYRNYDEALHKATELASRTLLVERVCVWLYSREKNAMVCEDLYLAETDKHCQGEVLTEEESLTSFYALRVGRSLVVDDIEISGRDSCPLNENYIASADIKSVLDVPIISHGEVVGILSCEKISEAKEWTLEAQDFSVSIANMVSLSLEIKQRREAESLLNASEKEQKQLLDNMIGGVISISETGLVLGYNRWAETIFGYSSEEVVGKNVSMLMTSKDKKLHDSYLNHYLKTGEAKVIRSALVVSGRRKNGEKFPMRLSVSELPDPAPGKPRFIGSCMDITEEQLKEEQLNRSEKMEAIGKLTGGISHDYNNMLGVILGYSELLRSKVEEGSELKKYADEIFKAGQRGAKLSSKLLDFSRKRTPESEVVDINHLIGEARNILDKSLTAQISLKLNLEGDLAPVWLDPADLDNALINLTINAKHAMENGGSLTISTKNITLNDFKARRVGLESGEYVLLSVVDTGKGIPKDIKDKIFDPFFTTKGGQGTGLGLNQIYGFVRRAKGVITVHSEVNLGARFDLYFPVYQGAEVAKQLHAIASEIDCSGSETILVVDDEEPLRELVADLLSQKGYKTLKAASGEEAIEILAKEKIDLLYSDVIMTGMDGYQLARQVRKDYPDIKIQLASGYTADKGLDAEDAELAETLLSKPVGAQVLWERIRVLLDGHYSAQANGSAALDAGAATEEKILKADDWIFDKGSEVPALDEDRDVMVSLLNNCYKIDHGDLGEGSAKELLSKLLDFSEDYFSREEMAMKVCRYSKLHTHSQQHFQLIKKLKRFSRELEADSLVVDEFVQFIESWFVGHMQEADADAIAFMAGKEEKISAALGVQKEGV